ncbi:beta-ketoacyl synthase chain length factor [Flavitalea sp.]|nr:beta-ketoacyl synthase chain length factor [Flavitalea sp.]
MFIRALASISPQQSFGAVHLPADPVVYHSNRLSCIEPDYKEWIDPKMIRRMSRIIKMGVATASLCLKQAGLEAPDAIVTGSAYGCLEDTGVFLNRMIEFNEEMLNPTSFIQSTHNTVGAQVALLVKCYGYNNTFAHRGFSFESALLDGILLLKDKEAKNVLVGAADEITNISFGILNRFGIYRQEEISNLDLITNPANGTIAGEGSTFFLLANEPSADDFAVLNAIHTFYKPARVEDVAKEISSFLKAQSLTIHEIDLVIGGMNGDLVNDGLYHQLNTTILSGTRVLPYKHLCGEYPTSSAFALWYAATELKTGKITDRHQPSAPGSANKKHVLIYNNYKNIHHSLFLVSSC